MAEITFEDAVSECLSCDPRYQAPAYAFVRDALHSAVKKFRGGDEMRHVTGQELLEGVKDHALEEYGPLAVTILAEWGITTGLDIGHVVYNLIEAEYFGRSDGDTLEDFDCRGTLERSLTEPYLPRSARGK